MRVPRRARRAIASRRPSRARTTRSSTASRRSTLPLRIAARSRGAAARASTSAARASTLTPGALSDWVTLTFHAAPGVDGQRHRRGCSCTEMDEHFSLYVSPINIDPEQPAMPISHPSYYATYLAKKIGAVRDARPRRGHLGAQRGRDRRRRRSCSRPTTSIASARRCSSPALDRLRRGSAGLRVRRHRSHPAHVLALHRPGASGRARARARRSTATPSASSTAQRRAGRPRAWRSCGDGDVLMVHLRSRLQLVPPRRQPESAGCCARATWRSSPAPTARPSGCATSTGRRRGPTASG